MAIIFQINVARNWGSTGRIAEQIGVRAQSKGWTCYIAHSTRYENESRFHSIRVSTPFEERVHFLRSLLTDACGKGSIVGTKRLIKKMREIKPDLIHLHVVHGYYINYKILFDYISSENIPVIWTFHDCWAFTGHCTYFDKIGCNKWKEYCFECPQIRSYPKSLYDNSKQNYLSKKDSFTSVKNMVIVPVSDWLGKFVRESFLGKYPIKVIHNGIDINMFKPTNSSLRTKLGFNDKFIILGVANGFDARKGLHDFVWLSQNLKNKWALILIGLKEKDIIKFKDNCLALGRTESLEDLVDYYSMADVFLNLTYEDNFPTTNLEALACGTPVITYNTGGCPEAIDNSTGFVVEKGDLKGVMHAISEVESKGKCFFSENSRNRAEKFYNKDLQFAEYINLYEELCNNK